MDGRDDGSPAGPHAEPGRSEAEYRRDQEGLGDPVRPVRIVLPGQAVTDRRVHEDRRQRDGRCELRDVRRREAFATPAHRHFGPWHPLFPLDLRFSARSDAPALHLDVDERAARLGAHRSAVGRKARLAASIDHVISGRDLGHCECGSRNERTDDRSIFATPRATRTAGLPPPSTARGPSAARRAGRRSRSGDLLSVSVPSLRRRCGRPRALCRER